MPSAAFTTLDCNINSLLQLLPTASPTGSYTQIQNIQIRSFKILSHAELEHYFETRCREIITAFQRNTNTIAGQDMKNRLTQYFSIKNTDKYTPYNYVHDNICRAYEQIIVSNHGIKESNLFKLLWPLGIDNGSIPSTLLPNLDSYGSKRGDLAHKGLHHSISFILDPQNESSTINQILHDVLILDAELDKLLQ